MIFGPSGTNPKPSSDPGLSQAWDEFWFAIGVYFGW